MTGIDGKMGGTFELMGKMTGISRWEIEGEKNIFITTNALFSFISANPCNYR